MNEWIKKENKRHLSKNEWVAVGKMLLFATSLSLTIIGLIVRKGLDYVTTWMEMEVWMITACVLYFVLKDMFGSLYKDQFEAWDVAKKAINDAKKAINEC